MSSSVNNQAPPPPSPAAGADVPRTPDTVATVSDSLSLTNSILIVLIGYLLWKMFGKRIGQSKSTLLWFCLLLFYFCQSACQHCLCCPAFTDLSCPRSNVSSLLLRLNCMVISLSLSASKLSLLETFSLLLNLALLCFYFCLPAPSFTSHSASLFCFLSFCVSRPYLLVDSCHFLLFIVF